MIQKDTLVYLNNLKNNNNKVWFDSHKKDYDAAKENILDLVTQIIHELSKQDIRYAELTASKCVFRINRDVRFSKNKNPYKDNFGASFSIGGKKSTLAGYYLHIQPGACFVGGGLWQPEPLQIKKIRQEIDYNWSDFNKIISTSTFKKAFADLNLETSLVNPPKGYEASHEAIKYLKLRSYVTTCSISDQEISSSACVKKIVTIMTTLAPLISFLNESIER